MESVGTNPVLMIISAIIQLALLVGVVYGLYRLIRFSLDKPILLVGLIVVAMLLIAVIVIGYAYLGALGRGMSL